MDLHLNLLKLIKTIFIVLLILPPSYTLADIEWPDQISGIEFNLAEVGYQVNQSEVSRSRLIFAAEQLINIHCIKEISRYYISLKEEGIKRCDEIIEKLKVLDPDNPILICMKNGYSSQICSNSFASIKLQSFNSYNSIDDKDVEAALASKIEDPNKYDDNLKLSALRQSLYSNPKSNAKDEIISILIRRAKKHCGIVRYQVLALPAQPTTPPTVKPQGTQKPFQDMLDQLSQKTTPTPKSIGPTRIRLVSPQCLDAVNGLKKYSPDNIAVICVEKGYFSPQCMRNQRTQKPGTNSNFQSNSGFEPF